MGNTQRIEEMNSDNIQTNFYAESHRLGELYAELIREDEKSLKQLKTLIGEFLDQLKTKETA